MEKNNAGMGKTDGGFRPRKSVSDVGELIDCKIERFGSSA
jgi:hypothetical protein